MITRYPLLAIAALCLSPVSAQLTILTQFNPSNTGGTCGIAYNSPDGEIMVIGLRPRSSSTRLVCART